MNVLKTIKPYKMVGNNIVFRGQDSFNYQGGAIIVIDGTARGTDPGILNSISPYDVESIKASANIADIQKYSGLNSTGVIEITMKKGPSNPDYPNSQVNFFPTIFWDPNVTTTDNQKFSVSVPVKVTGSNQKTLIQGMDTFGNLFIWHSK
jgi:hypothetical protein